MASLTAVKQRFWNNDGTVAASGKVYVYLAGTTTLTNSYTDSTGVTPNANPIILDAKGEATIFTDRLVKLNVLQSDNVQITGYPMDYTGQLSAYIGTPLYANKWIGRTSAADNGWNGIAWNGTVFAAVAYSGAGNRVMTSPDGITWTIRTSAADNQWLAIAWNGTVFAAVANTGVGNRVMTSPDGITWTIRTSAADNQWYGIAWNGTVFAAVASTGVGNRVMTSPDGITWTIRVSAADNNWYGIAWNGTVFAAVATTGTGNRVMTTPEYAG